MRRRLWMIPAGIAAVILFAWLGGTIVKLLWNWLMPELFGLPQLDYWKALGLLALTRILFGGFGRCGGPGRYRRNMSPEDRDRIKHRMRDWCAEPAEKEPEA